LAIATLGQDCAIPPPGHGQVTKTNMQAAHPQIIYCTLVSSRAQRGIVARLKHRRGLWELGALKRITRSLCRSDVVEYVYGPATKTTRTLGVKLNAKEGSGTVSTCATGWWCRCC